MRLRGMSYVGSFALGGLSLGVVSALWFAMMRTVVAVVAGTDALAEARSQLITAPLFATCAGAGFAVVGWALGCELRRLCAAAATDPLTVVANRRAFEERFEAEFERARESRMPVALLVIDVDELKSINDKKGHAAGDVALRAAAAAISRSCRARDVVARWGGDEFVVLMSRTRANEALAVAERIHRALDGITVSIGVADAQPESWSRPASLFQAADRALLRAKQRGRNRTCMAESTDRSGAIILEDPEACESETSGYHVRVKSA